MESRQTISGMTAELPPREGTSGASGASRGSGTGPSVTGGSGSGAGPPPPISTRAIGTGASTSAVAVGRKRRWKRRLRSSDQGRRRVRAGGRAGDDDRERLRLRRHAHDPGRSDLGSTARGHANPLTRNERELLGSRVATAACLDSCHVFILVRSCAGDPGAARSGGRYRSRRRSRRGSTRGRREARRSWARSQPSGESRQPGAFVSDDAERPARTLQRVARLSSPIPVCRSGRGEARPTSPTSASRRLR